MEIIKKFEVSKDDMSYLLVAAFEGGINYWCGEIKISKLPEDYIDGEEIIASDVIGRNGELLLFDIEDSNERWFLTQENMLKGISKAMDHLSYVNFEEFMDDHDADTADIVIQFALFDEIIFG